MLCYAAGGGARNSTVVRNRVQRNVYPTLQTVGTAGATTFRAATAPLNAASLPYTYVLTLQHFRSLWYCHLGRILRDCSSRINVISFVNNLYS